MLDVLNRSRKHELFERGRQLRRSGALAEALRRVVDGDAAFADHQNALGDLNGDGIDDVAITATYGNLGGAANAGEIYVLFGKRTTPWGNPFSLDNL